jgi:hypothetical protein
MGMRGMADARERLGEALASRWDMCWLGATFLPSGCPGEDAGGRWRNGQSSAHGMLVDAGPDEECSGRPQMARAANNQRW